MGDWDILCQPDDPTKRYFVPKESVWMILSETEDPDGHMIVQAVNHEGKRVIITARKETDDVPGIPE